MIQMRQPRGSASPPARGRSAASHCWPATAPRAVLLAYDQLDAGAARRCGLVERTGSPQQASEWAAGMTALTALTLAYSKQALTEVFESPPPTWRSTRLSSMERGQIRA